MSSRAAEPSIWLVDSHCHIDMPQFDADRDEMVARTGAAGLAEMLVVGEVDDFRRHSPRFQGENC